jgi:AAA family ATP:ADP antiporter
MKNAIFVKIVGSSSLGHMKIVSALFMIALVLVYSKMVDWFEKQKLVYILMTFYAGLYLAIAYFLTHPTIGLANTIASSNRIFGWIIYLAIESFGSLGVALFWSFVTSSVDAQSAKKGYPMIFAIGQTGPVTGAILVMNATKLSLPFLFFLSGISILAVPLIIRFFVSCFPVSPTHSQPVQEKRSTGPIEGLRLLVSRPYLIGILGVSTLYEVVATFFDIQMNTIAGQYYTTAAQMAEFLGIYALVTNLVSLTFAIAGTSFFIRRFGLTFCLTAFPVTAACVVAVVWKFHSLWILLGAMVSIKALSYALNNPCKEIMYIPTSRDVRFKVKGWIDTFAGRSAKAVGGGVVSLFPAMSDLIIYGSLISLGIVGIWVAAALFVGRTNQALVREKQIIE